MIEHDPQQQASPSSPPVAPQADEFGALPSSALVADLQQDKSTNLERVIDVPLAVHLRFGQRRLSLREVLALSTGSLVELDRQVEEPVDLVLGDRLIARGEVVIVDGNYGLRVTEVVEGAAKRIQRQQSVAHRATVAREEEQL